MALEAKEYSAAIKVDVYEHKYHKTKLTLQNGYNIYYSCMVSECKIIKIIPLPKSLNQHEVCLGLANNRIGLNTVNRSEFGPLTG